MGLEVITTPKCPCVTINGVKKFVDHYQYKFDKLIDASIGDVHHVVEKW
jgi:hypothetical protein